jgi:hypothetical protein
MGVGDMICLGREVFARVLYVCVFVCLFVGGGGESKAVPCR